MSLSETPSAERTHIAFFGCTNSGKSSLINAVTGQNLSIVSEVKGTTTDAIKKTMEILPLGPVVVIDTAGIDDNSELGQQRIEKTYEILRQTDIAVLVVDATKDLTDADKKLLDLFKEKSIPFIVAYNKIDLLASKNVLFNYNNKNSITVSAKNNENILELKNKIAEIIQQPTIEKFIIADKVSEGDVIILVTPIDSSAPKGRLILPQQLTLRELLDKHCIPVCCQVEELAKVLKLFPCPKLVITDSQAFRKVSEIIDEKINLTSFSILFARYKGNLKTLVNGAFSIDNLKNGDKILISEGCTHHRQCGDIGTVKLPALLKKYTQKDFEYIFTSGNDFPNDLSKYSLIIHCGACMLNPTEVQNRIKIAEQSDIPIVNYGVAISYMNGILQRCLKIFNNEIF